jgi:hypothetical protein
LKELISGSLLVLLLLQSALLQQKLLYRSVADRLWRHHAVRVAACMNRLNLLSYNWRSFKRPYSPRGTTIRRRFDKHAGRFDAVQADALPINQNDAVVIGFLIL